MLIFIANYSLGLVAVLLGLALILPRRHWHTEPLPNVRRQLPCPVGDNYLDRLTDM